MITLDDIREARERIAPCVVRTPMKRSVALSDRLGTNVYLKMELFQKTGSFKPRGAFNQMLHLDAAARERGVGAVSGGNFAQGVAYAGAALGVQTVIVMPDFTPRNYVDATRGYGASVKLMPDLAACFAQVEEFRQQGMTILHPFDNPRQMAGCGTIGLEILEDAPDATDVVISIGGGGLIGGITAAVKALKPSVRLWGVETEGSATMHAALQAGEVVRITPTSLAKTLGAPYVSAGALALMQAHLEELIVVSDREAIDAQRFILERTKILTELAASCTLAAADRIRERFRPGDHVVLLLCGGNESLENMMRYAEMAQAR